jgi:hypothetical protein
MNLSFSPNIIWQQLQALALMNDALLGSQLVLKERIASLEVELALTSSKQLADDNEWPMRHGYLPKQK